MPYLQIGDWQVEIVYKRVRHLRLVVQQPDGRLRLTVPPRTAEATLRELVLQKAAWIRKHQAVMRARPAAAPLRYVAGEIHYYLGQPYPLHVHEQPGRAQVALADGALHLRVPPGTPAAQRQRVLAGWYRAQLAAQLPPLLAKWEPLVGAQAQAWGIRQMKTRWGTCSIRPRRIWLNLELSKWPLPCLEYVVVHELTHLHERLHNARFWALLGQAMPDWRAPHQALRQGTPVGLSLAG